jgi:hypothetical protein
MNFGELLDRYYDVVGDRRAMPFMYPLDRAKSLINEGCRQFRNKVQDKWVEQTIETVKDQGVYEAPPGTVRIERLAFEDRTIAPVTMHELVSRNHRWKAEPSRDRPRAWTTEDVQYNEFRIWPPVNDDSPVAATMASEYGVLVRVIKADGTNATMPSEVGGLVNASGSAMNSEFGVLVGVNSTGAPNITLWLVEGVGEGMVNDGDLLPISEAYYMAPVYYALVETYRELHDHHNPELAAYYAAKFVNEVEVGKLMFSKFFAHMLVGIGADPTNGLHGDINLPSEVNANGSQYTVMWGKHAGADDFDGFFEW